MNSSGSCLITTRDLLGLPASEMQMNPILKIAMKYGCPVDGFFYPKLCDDVRYIRIDHLDDTIEIRWEPL